MDLQTAKKKATRVLIAGIISNFSVGILYTWSNLKDALEYTNKLGIQDKNVLPEDRMYPEWTQSDLALPYGIGGFTSALIVVLAGAWQDKIGPTKVILTGVLMTGLGAIACSFLTNSPMAFTFVFAMIVGNGIGFVYACPRAAAMKWFHPSKKGMINGLVVAGFGLGAMWLGPLETLFLKGQAFVWTFEGFPTLSLENTLRVLGTLILAMGIPAALNVVNPPAGYEVPEPEVKEDKPVKENAKKTASISTAATAKTWQAWALFFVYAFYCSAGAMVISNSSDIMRVQSGLTQNLLDENTAALATSLLGVMVPITSISNATGRSLGGMISDVIGRKNVYYVIHTIQAINMFFFHTYTSPYAIVAGVILTCVVYGSVMSTTPSIVADYYGLKAYGANYGVIYTGWGLSLVIGPQIAAYSKTIAEAPNESYFFAYKAAIVLIAISLVLAFLVKKPKFRQEDVIDDYILGPDELKK
ncbi:MAG: OFA family MFS transporter [Flavobacteriaceae bacterium]|nr:OFA family MFS transporter [Flavobacteriaceae bacterium]